MVKTISLIILILGMIISAGVAYCADLKWDASTGDVDGYNVYFTDGVDNYTANVGNVTEVVDINTTFNLYPEKEYSFHVTAYNLMGESGISNSVNYTRVAYVVPEWNIPIKKDKPSVIINLILE